MCQNCAEPGPPPRLPEAGGGRGGGNSNLHWDYSTNTGAEDFRVCAMQIPNNTKAPVPFFKKPHSGIFCHSRLEGTNISGATNW